MGGSGGGGFSSGDLDRLRAAAEERLQDLASDKTMILFLCEQEDRASLDSHLKRSSVFESGRIIVRDGSHPDQAKRELDSATVVIMFTNLAHEAEFLNQIADDVLVTRKQVIHVKAAPESRIPAKVTSYRWQSVDWKTLEEIFS